MPFDFAKELAELKQETARLNEELAKEGISEAKEVAIRAQLTANQQGQIQVMQLMEVQRSEDKQREIVRLGRQLFWTGQNFGNCDEMTERTLGSKETLQNSFHNKCLITGRPYINKEQVLGSPTHKIAHIISRKSFKYKSICALFEIDETVCDGHANYLYLDADVEHELDIGGICFVPNTDGTFRVLQTETSKKETPGDLTGANNITIPDAVSRKLLMVHAMTYHAQNKLPFEFESWSSLPPRMSTDSLIQHWLEDTKGAEKEALAASTAGAEDEEERTRSGRGSDEEARPKKKHRAESQASRGNLGPTQVGPKVAKGRSTGNVTKRTKRY